MGDHILLRDLALTWECPYCGAKPARHDGYGSSRINSWCKPDCPKPQGPMPRE